MRRGFLLTPITLGLGLLPGYGLLVRLAGPGCGACHRMLDPQDGGAGLDCGLGAHCILGLGAADRDLG